MKNTTKLWKLARNGSAALALFCWYLAASTSDFYALELRQPDPASVGHLVLAGALLLTPTVFHIAVNYIKRHKNT